MGRGRHDVYLIDYSLGGSTAWSLLHGRRRPRLRRADDPADRPGRARRRPRRDAGRRRRLPRKGAARRQAAGTVDPLQPAGEAARRRARAPGPRADRRAGAGERGPGGGDRRPDSRRGGARAADRRKDEFLSTLAHELRNPLAPIRNALEIMRLAGDASPTVEASREP